MSEDRAEDPIEALLAAVVMLPDDQQDRELDDLCAAHPVLAAALRERHAFFRRLQRTSTGPGSPVAGRRFGEFELLRELGRGGMGVVFLARQQRAGDERLVALKIVRDRGLLSERASERFRREAAASFRLDDPGICPVIDAGEVDGVPWLAMRHVPGRTLADHIGAARSSGVLALPAATTPGADSETTSGSGADAGRRFATVLAIGEALARSLHVAHEAGFVHRDVKPGNVMIRPDGHPVLLDFGLVWAVSGEHSLTATGEPLGTPAYMPPEQIDGGAVGRTADVYSLAATLFETIALKPPFTGRTREELFRSILQHDLPDLRRIVPGVSRDLHTVLSTALAREPERRYATALDFALDLGRVRRREPILARPPGPLRRLGLWTARNRLAAVLLGSLAAALAVVVFVAIEARSQERRATGSLEGARRAVAELIRVQQEELDGVPWLEQTRRDLQTRALGFLREFMASNRDNAGLVLANAEAMVLAAQLELSLGNPAAARQLQAEARGVLDGRAAVVGGRAVRGHWQMLAGELLRREGAAAAAAAAFAAAAADLEAGARGDEDLVAAMHASQRAAAMHEQCNDRPAAFAAIEHAVTLRGRLVDAAATRTAVATAAALRQRAQLHLEANGLEQADADCRAASQLLRQVRLGAPYERQATTLLAEILMLHSDVLRQRGRQREQLAVLQEAIELSELLVRAFPSMPRYREQLALACQRLAMFKVSGGDEAERLRDLDRARGLLAALVAEFPEQVEYRARLASVLYDLGMCQAEDEASSTASYTTALEHLDHALARDQDHAECRRLAAVTATGLANSRAYFGDARAGGTYELARTHAAELLRLRPEDRKTKDLLANVLFNHGVYHCEQGDLASCGPLLDEAVRLLEASAAAAPLDAKTAVLMLLSGVHLGHITALWQPDRAAATWERVRRAWAAVPEPMRRTVPDDDMVSTGACCLERALAAPRARAGDVAAARELMAVHAWLSAILARSPASSDARFELIACLADLAAHAEAIGAAAEAAMRRTEIATLLEQWPEGGFVSRAKCMRAAALRSELERCITDNERATARLRRLLEGAQRSSHR